MKKITVRPCKEKPGKWEIMGCNGKVLERHYSDKDDAIKYAKKVACEASLELVIED